MGWEAVTLVLCMVLLVLAPPSSAEVPVPPLKARVNDLTGTLSFQQRTTLEQTLAALEQQKGAQVAVLLVPTVQPETVEQFAVRVFDQWKLGRKGVDDGVLLVIARDDRTLRIEVGYGLEGVLPDVIAKRIIDEEIVPFFKQGDYYGGITAGVYRISRVIAGEPLPLPKTFSQHAARLQHSIDIGDVMSLIVGLLFGAFIFMTVGGVVGAGLMAVPTGMLASEIAGYRWPDIGFMVGALIFILAMAANERFGGKWSVLRWTKDRWFSGDTGGGFDGGGGGFSGGGGGFDGGGGGFSGGGGGSGGGGASGSW